MRTTVRILLILLVISALPSIARGELVTNGGFETHDFTGWTLSGNTVNSYVDIYTTGNGGPGPHSGTYDAIFGPEPNGNVANPVFLAQDINTVSGLTYDLTFWLAWSPGSPSTATASWNGAQVFGQSDTNIPTPYQEFTFLNLPATSASTPLEFSFTVSEGYWFLDDVSVVRTPDTTPGTIPEPATICLILLGMCVCLWRRSTLVSRTT